MEPKSFSCFAPRFLPWKVTTDFRKTDIKENIIKLAFQYLATTMLYWHVFVFKNAFFVLSVNIGFQFLQITDYRLQISGD